MLLTGQRIIWLIILMVFFQVGQVMADEVTDQVNEAMGLYKEGKYSQAASELEFAVQQIREKQVDQLKKALPKPLAGWKADDPEGAAAGAAMFGGGVTASKRYYKGESEAEAPEVRAEIITDSPLLQGMLMFFSNPAILGAQGGKVTKVKSYKAILKKEGSGGQAELSLVVANKILVKLSGQMGATEADLLAYGNAIDYSLLEKMGAP